MLTLLHETIQLSDSTKSTKFSIQVVKTGRAVAVKIIHNIFPAKRPFHFFTQMPFQKIYRVA